MAEIIKPDYTHIWSSGGAIVAPSNAKIQTGWTAEVPPFQWENWSQNRQDKAIAHIMQHGLSVWDSLTEYQSGKSYVQGSDGFVYKAVTTNTNIDPVGDVSGAWGTAFVTPSQATQVASAAQARALSSNTVFISPLQLANAFTGTNQSIGPVGHQNIPGGLIIQWGTATAGASNAEGPVTPFSIPFPNAVLALVGTHGLSSSGAAYVAAGSVNNTNFTFRGSQVTTLGLTYIAVGY